MNTNTIKHNIQEPLEILGSPDNVYSLNGGLGTASSSLMNLDTFKSQYPTVDGRNSAVVVIDTGINLTHPAFSNRIVYHYDFGDNDNNGTDTNGHGSNVSSIIASSHPDYPGVAEGVDIIHLKIFTTSGSTTSSKLEQALRWVIDHSANNPNAISPTFNISAINMSLGDGKNWNTNVQPMGVQDELDVLANQLDIIPVSAAGNYFADYASVQGVSYPAADRNSLAVSSVFDRNVGSTTYWRATSSVSGPDIIAAYSQRHGTLTTAMAPGVQILGAAKSGTGTSVYTGTSQATPQVTGVVVLAQELAEQTLGRRLTFTEISNLLKTSATTVNDGDDEVDNVTNTSLNFKRVDMMKLAEKIIDMAPPPPAPPSTDLKISTNGTTHTGSVAEYGSLLGITNIGPYTFDIENENQLNVTGNTWLQIPIDYNITENTVLEFDFRSTQVGEIHGIGFDTDNRYSSSPDAQRAFKLYGTETWGLGAYKYTDAGNWQNLKVSVGDFFSGNFKQLFFANDQDVSTPTATSSYKNIKIYEVPKLDFTIDVNGNNHTAKIGQYGGGKSETNIGTYSANVENQTQLNITGNTWLQIPINYTITPNTILEFDFQSTQRGEIHGIGFDTNNSYDAGDNKRGPKLYGTQGWGVPGYNYIDAGNWQTFKVSVGNFLSGNFQRLFFVNDHDVANSTVASNYKNIKIYEGSFPSLKIDVNGTAQTGEVREYGKGLSIANIGTYTANVQNQTQLDISGNTWLQVPIDYTVTPNTVLKFDFRSTQRGEIHGIGFDTDNSYAATPDKTNGFKLYGTESWGTSGNSYTNVGNWQSFEINLGQYQNLAGTNFKQLSFINDQDVINPTATSSFKDIQIVETV